jgi:chromosome segregation ATPase
MIDIHILEGAKNIRTKYLQIIDDVNANQEALKELSEFLNKKLAQLKNIHDNEFKNKPTKDEIARVTALIVKEIEDLEVNEQRISKKFEKLNTELEILKKDENVLYNTIKTKYPHLSDQQIRDHLANYLGE